MSRMKHLLRKLHIGGSVEPNNPQEPVRESRHDGSYSSSSGQPSSSSSSLVPARSRGGNLAEGNGRITAEEFNYFEEEYQVQLALAISVSNPDARDDPESFQINAAKRISLGCPPSPDSTLSLRYWNYNVVNYDEKVMDGFYDIYGVISNLSLQERMPSLEDFQATSITDNVDYEVVLVNRAVDTALEQLGRRAVSIALECRAAELGPVVSGLVQKITDLVVDSMGGPVDDANEMLSRWMARSYELRTSLNTRVFHLGCLDIGLSRHRALLFKVLSDRINLPCRLVKGSHYTGTDEGAVNIIKIDHESEFIIDLMGAPGALIPAEIPSFHPQNSQADTMSSVTTAQTVNNLLLAHDAKINCQSGKKSGGFETNPLSPDFIPKIVGSGSAEASKIHVKLSGNNGEKLSERHQTERFEHEFGMLLPSLNKPCGSSLATEEVATPAQLMKVKDVSKYVISAAQNPEFAQKLHAVLLESGASPSTDVFSSVKRHQDPGGLNPLRLNGLAEKRKNMSSQLLCEGPLISFLGVDSMVHGGADPENNPKQLSDGLIWKEKPSLMDGDIIHAPVISNAICLGFCLPSRSEEFTILGNGSNEMALYGMATRSCEKQFENALIGDSVQRISKNLVAESFFHLQEGEEIVKDPLVRLQETINNDQHIASISLNEWTHPVLDDVAEWEIPWEDLQIGERIGLGSYGEVYHADWNGTEVAVKKFLDQDFSGDALEQFRCEVKIMLRLRHPNVVLFMGAVTRPPHLSILTEFLPRGSLYRLLHRPNVQVDEKRRLRMARDVAKGMNYLHTSHPTIVHRDLKSLNLLVDKNWVVKVCDFGLSRLKHHTFLSSQSTAGTPEWMAPEVLRNELSNEKCDVYSFGVILWELATLRMPWNGMNWMQVVGAVGFQNRHLDIPEEINPMVAQIIRDCWQNEPNLRPSFAELMASLKHLQWLVVEIT